MEQDEIQEYLNPIYDLELWSAVSVTNPLIREIWFLLPLTGNGTLRIYKQVLAEFKSPLLTKINEDMDPLTDITSLIRNSITDDPPLAQKTVALSGKDIMKM